MLLERSYSSVVPHSAMYWETGDADTLRAESYQELINALLLLLGEHSEDGVVRYYGDDPNPSAMAGEACVEVRRETALGAYLLDYITFAGNAENDYYELKIHFGYRRSAEEQEAIVNATSTEALPDLLRAAIASGQSAVAIRVGYFGTSRAGVTQMVAAVRDEFFLPEDAPAEEPGGADAAEGAAIEAAEGDEAAGAEEAAEEPAAPDAVPAAAELPAQDEDGGGEEAVDVSPWQVLFYPDNEQPGIVEVIL